MADVLVLLDSNGRVQYCSGNAPGELGLHPEEMVGQSLSDVLLNQVSHLVSVESLASLLELVRQPSDTTNPNSVEIICSGPQHKEYLATVFPISGTPGDTRTGLIIRDVTEEREVDTRRDTFIAVLSHELRDPITAMMGFTSLLLDTASFNPTEREWLDNIQTCGQRLTTITSDMLDVVGIRTGNLSVDLGPVNLRTVLNEVLPQIKGAYRRFECSVTIPCDLPLVMADKNRLAQVLGNLLSNAVKYSPEGGVARVCAHHEAQQKQVVIAVADQGLGIAPEDIDNIFSAFQRSHRPETRGVKGVGLGLYIVKGLVELMHGNLWVKSEVGRGSTFYLSLPIAPETSFP